MLEIIDEIRPLSKQRATLREWAGYFLGVVSLVSLVVLATNAYAQTPQFVAHLGENKLYLYNEPCPLGGWFATWRKAEWIWEGKPVASCWVAGRDNEGQLYAHTVDAMGSPGSVPLRLFRKVLGV